MWTSHDAGCSHDRRGGACVNVRSGGGEPCPAMPWGIGWGPLMPRTAAAPSLTACVRVGLRVQAHPHSRTHARTQYSCAALATAQQRERQALVEEVRRGVAGTHLRCGS